jgi:hypothetical protein
MNPEFKRHLDEIGEYVAAAPAEARAALMQALVERLLSEFRPGHFADRGNVFRVPPTPTATKSSTDEAPPEA